MINCGIIGFGKMGMIRAKAIEASGIGRVSAIYDVSLPAAPSYPVAETADAILQSPDIDAVFVCTPNHLIPKHCIDALCAGKHVFSEKPPGFNAAQVEAVIEAERAAGGRKLMYGFNHRHHRSIMRMKQIVDDGELGKVLWLRGRYGKEVDPSYFDGWRANPELAGAGILLDQGIHMADLMLQLGGGFDEVHAFVSNLFWKIEGIEDNVFAIFRNSRTGACASLHSTMTQWRYLFSLEVFLEGGALILNGLKTSSGAYGDEMLAVKRNPSHLQDGRFEEEEQITYRTDTSWQSEIDHFFDCIERDTPVLYGNSQDALTVMQLIDRIYAVDKQERPVP
ncbi:MAG: Gfo/Idh/MocA family oxidoreductase [Thiocapsa sp.]|uniref:Gfo/Idh/MocA family protein n=1 Tax=Thiocapsa sp. TaxID=2024551 RepID=UPI001BCCF2E1|nr:Gfo/Idh/MocA family oxidoreductase [Thiocapsa sp.]QVL50106.1 MAG: Gfo/Idh/MocA family oxidoreductase [Thiocapsa sp.]